MNAQMPPAGITVMIADDHIVVREGLIAILNRQSDISVVAEASDGAEAISAWDRLHPDVALLDLRMPVLDGIAVTSELRRRDPTTKVIILTSFDADFDVARGLAAGARGYMLKDSTPDELARCVRAVNRGEVFVAPSVASRLETKVKGDLLTPREHDVLEQLGRGYSNVDIAAELGIGEGTVKLHMKSILSKLDASSRADAIVVAIKRGFLRI